MARRHDEGWRWDPQRHPYPTEATIAVSAPTNDQLAERERRIKAGAVVVPFGFARVLAPRPVEHAEPDAWEGMGLLSIAAEAAALKARYGALLAPEPSFYRPDVDRVEDALDAARARLQGTARAEPDQLALDLR